VYIPCLENSLLQAQITTIWGSSMIQNSKDYIFTSESVSEGHPDKICDRISDAVLDHFITHEPEARVACETAVTTDFICLLGEVRSQQKLSKDVIQDIARQCVKDIGYDQSGFSWKDVNVILCALMCKRFSLKGGCVTRMNSMLIQQVDL